MLEALLKDGWSYHDTQSERLARELESAAEAAVAPTLLVSFLDLSIHTIGMHLGDWPRALVLGKRIVQGHTPSAETAKAWAGLYVSAVLSADVIGAAEFEFACLGAADDALASMLDMRFMLADALVAAKRDDEGARLYRSALALAGRIEGSPDFYRSVSVASNNLAWTLYEMPERTRSEGALMRLAADASYTFWARCGTWINEERALYLKSLVAHAMGDPVMALTCADTALDVIAANGERPLDTALLHLARAQSLAALGDGEGKVRALADADVAAERLLLDDLRQQFVVERAKLAGRQEPGRLIKD